MGPGYPGPQLKLILCGSELGTPSVMDDYAAPLHGRFDHYDRRRKPRYAIFSGGEFDPRLEAVVEDEGVLLIGAQELFSADG
jgi:hypothetical protein